MENLYRCDKCGNHFTLETDEGLTCHVCEGNKFTEVTEANKNKLPFPTHLGVYEPIDRSVCNDSPGFCPCGDYITHPADEPCNVINEEVDKQTRTWPCQCATEYCPCGAYLAHKVDEPCTSLNLIVKD